MHRKDIVFSFLLIVFIVFTFFRFAKDLKKYFMASASLIITTEKAEYLAGDNLRLKIKNDSGKELCFSTCYPYFLERKEENWERYNYVECKQTNIHNGCIKSEKEKAFELTLPEVEAGLHRLVVPVCSEYKPEEGFKEETEFYSNEFLIK